MIVAVTGSGGFIGTAVQGELLLRDHGVRRIDLPHFDVQDKKGLFDAIRGVDAVVHLAGVLGTHELFDDPHKAVDVNIHGSLNVLEVARDLGISYVGITMPKVFPSIYTATKTTSELLEKAFYRTFGLPVSRVRAFNAYGLGQKVGPGHPQKIVPTFATEAWAGRPIPIWGDGTQTVDLIHAEDLARMLVDALDFGEDETFDGGTGIAFSVNEVAEMVLDITGSKAGVQYLPMRRGEIPTQIVATGEGWDKLNWKPEFDADRFRGIVEWYGEK